MTEPATRAISELSLLEEPGLGEAIRRRWWIILLLGAVLASAGAVAGNQQNPAYVAKSTLTVANVDFETRSVPGFVQAAASLTSSYSQSVGTRAIVVPVARKLNLPVNTVANHLTSTPVPGSALFTISAEGADKPSAVALCRAATDELVQFVRGLDDTEVETRQALRDFRRLARREASLADDLVTLRAKRETDEGSVDRDRLLSVQEDRASAQIQADAAKGRYQLLRQGTPSSEARRVSVLTMPTTATSDRIETTQRLAGVGLIAGLTVGLMIVALLAQRRHRRSTT